MDKEKIIKGCENWANNHKDENLLLTYSSVVELLAVLKEQEERIKLLEYKLETLTRWRRRPMRLIEEDR